MRSLLRQSRKDLYSKNRALLALMDFDETEASYVRRASQEVNLNENNSKAYIRKGHEMAVLSLHHNDMLALMLRRNLMEASRHWELMYAEEATQYPPRKLRLAWDLISSLAAMATSRACSIYLENTSSVVAVEDPANDTRSYGIDSYEGGRKRTET